MLWLGSEYLLPRFAAASEQQSDRWGNLGGKDRQQGGIGQRPARRYSLDSTVNIFRSLHALPLPAELRDAAVTDPEMLATHEAPANVMQLLAEPLHAARGSLVEDAEQGWGSQRPGQSTEHTVDQTFSAAVDAPAVSASEVQSQPPTLLGNPRAEASADSGPAVAAGHEQIYSYKDPAGAMQVSSFALHRRPVGLCICAHHIHEVHAQGNFSRVEIMRWHEDGYFGLDLPLRCVKDGADSPLRPLGDWMHDWEHGGLQLAPPPGFATVIAATSGEPGAVAPSAQTPAASQAAASQRLQQDQHRLVDTSGNQHSTHGQLYGDHLFAEATARQMVAIQAKGDANGVLDQQGDGQLHNAQHATTMQAFANGLRSVTASQDVTGASGGSEQMQQQQALASRPSAALSSAYPQLPWLQHQQQLPPPHYPIQQPEQLLLQPHGLPPSLPQQRSALQTELSMGWTPPSLAAPTEGLAVPMLRPRLPAFAQLRAGGSSQDAEQEADVNELIELLRQPVSCECMVIVARPVALASLPCTTGVQSFSSSGYVPAGSSFIGCSIASFAGRAVRHAAGSDHRAPRMVSEPAFSAVSDDGAIAARTRPRADSKSTAGLSAASSECRRAAAKLCRASHTATAPCPAASPDGSRDSSGRADASPQLARHAHAIRASAIGNHHAALACRWTTASVPLRMA